MEMEPPHPPEEDDHLTDFLSEDDQGTDPVVDFTTDDEPFQEKLEHLRPRGVTMANNILHDKAQSEDLVDQVVVNLFAHRKRPSPDTPFDAWFLVCVRNAAVDLTRSPEWHRSDDTVLRKVPSNDDNPLEHVLRNERIERIREALAKLSSEDQQLLRLWFVEEKTLKHMAGGMNMKMNTLYSRIMRAKKRLLKHLRGGRP